MECAAAKTPLNGLDIIEKLKRGRGKVRDEAIALLDMAPTLLSELLRLRYNENDAPPGSAFGNAIETRLKEAAGKLSVTRITAFAFALHNARQAILTNNMNPQLALEGALMTTRDRHRTTIAGT